MKLRIEIVDESGKRFGGEVTLAPVGGMRKKMVQVKAGKKDSRVSCRAVARGLWQAGHFRQPRTFGTAKELLFKNGGYTFPDPTLANTLREAEYLTRKGSTGKFTWVQKYPYKA